MIFKMMYKNPGGKPRQGLSQWGGEDTSHALVESWTSSALNALCIYIYMYTEYPMVFGSSIRSAEVIRPKKSQGEAHMLGPKIPRRSQQRQASAKNSKAKRTFTSTNNDMLRPKAATTSKRTKKRKSGEAENFKPT